MSGRPGRPPAPAPDHNQSGECSLRLYPPACRMLPIGKECKIDAPVVAEIERVRWWIEIFLTPCPRRLQPAPWAVPRTGERPQGTTMGFILEHPENLRATLCGYPVLRRSQWRSKLCTG